MYFPWSGSEESVDEVLDPLGVVIETVTLRTQRLTHIRKTKSGVRIQEDVRCLEMITDGLLECVTPGQCELN